MNAPLSFRRSALTAALAGALFAAGAAQAATVTWDAAIDRTLAPVAQIVSDDILPFYKKLENANQSVQVFDQRFSAVSRYRNADWSQYAGKTDTEIVAGAADGSQGNTLTAVFNVSSRQAEVFRDVLTVAGSIAGGWVNINATDTIAVNPAGVGAASGDASGNTVNISGANPSFVNVYGGLSLSGAASNNKLDIRGTEVAADTIAGGAGATTNGNKVSVTADTIAARIVAGSVGASGGAHSGNTLDVTVGGGSITAVAGTFMEATHKDPDIWEGGSDNTVNLKIAGDTRVENLYGGLSGNNTVNVTGESNSGVDRIIGGQYDNNTVTLAGEGRYIDVAGAGVAGGSNNTVTINGGELLSAAGGRTDLIPTSILLTEVRPVDVSGNTVIFNAGNISGMLAGGYTTHEKAAHNNYVLIQGTAAVGDLYGPDTPVVVGGAAGGSVDGNTVEIAGGKLQAIVYAAYAIGRSATNNKVILRGTPDLINAEIYGSAGDPGYTHENNTLEVRTGNHTVGKVANFENYTFQVPGDAADGFTMLTVKDAGGTDISNAKVQMYVEQNPAGYNLDVGDRVHLVTNENGVTAENIERQTYVARAGVGLQQEFKLETTDTSLDAVMIAEAPQPQTTVVNTARTTALSMLAQMVDFTQNQSLRCPKDADGNQSLTCLWAAAAGTNYRYDMGANADYNRVHGSQFVMGVRGKLNDSASDEVTGAAFFETGRAKFKSAGLNSKAKGDNEFYGLGTILRWAATDGALKGLYAEGNAQLGWSTSDMNAQLADSTYNVKFHNKAFGGAGLGAGYVFDLTNSLSLDTYARYQWTRINGGKVNVEGETFKFDSVDSQRARVGTRLEAAPSANFRAYVGAAFEREFDGKSTATIQGYDVNPTTLRGNYGLGEIGVRYTPADSKGWTVEGNLTGFAGKKDGFTGSITAAYKF